MVCVVGKMAQDVETVTFGHFSNVSWMGVPFVMSLTTMHAKESNIWLLSLLACIYQL